MDRPRFLQATLAAFVMRRGWGFVPWVAWVILAGCGADVEPGGGGVVPTWNAVETLRIGSVDDETSALTWFREMAVGPDGEVVTYHPQEFLLRIHGRDGSLLATAGGEGEGPGELKGFGTVGILGDSLWVLDTATYRLSYFGFDGRFLGSVAVPIDLGEGGAGDPPRPNDVLADGSLVGQSPLWSHEVVQGTITDAVVYRMDGSGATTDSLVSYSVVNTMWAIADPDSPNQFQMFDRQPFVDTELVEISPYRMEYLHVDRTVGEEPPHRYRLTLVEIEGDTIFSVAEPYRPQPITGELVDRLVEERAAPFENMTFPGAPTRSRAAELARESLYLPAHQPRVSAALAGLDGTWWVRHEDAGADSVSWSCVNRSGKIVGRVLLPRDFTMMAVSREHAWGLILDALDVPYIVRFDFSGPTD